MGGGGAQCCSGGRLRLDIAAPIVSRSRPELLCGLAASQPRSLAASPRDRATPRPRDPATARPRDPATPRPVGNGRMCVAAGC